MKHFYEDIFRVIGEFGPWQCKRVAVLWWFMFLIGIHFTTEDYLDFTIHEFFCDVPNCTSYDTSFFVNKSVSLNDKVNIFKYDFIWPRLKATKVSPRVTEQTAIFCKVYYPNVDAEGKCNWNFKEEELEDKKKYQCPPGPGNHFHFNEKLKAKTAVAYFGLLCDNFNGQGKLKIVHAGGSLVGIIIGATIMSRKGRRNAFIYSLISIALGSSISCFNNFYYAFLPGAFLILGGCLSLYQVNLIYLVEIVGWRKQVFSRFRWFTYNSLIGTSIFVPYYLGKLLTGVVIEVISLDFDIYCILIAVLSILSIFLVYFLPESPRWLLVTYKTDDAKKIIMSIAEENKEKIDLEIEVIEKKKDHDVDGAKLKDYIKIQFGRKYEDILMELRSYKWKIIICSQCSIYTIAFIWCGILSHMNSDYIKGVRRQDVDITHSTLIHFGLNLLGVAIVMLLEGKLGRRTVLLLFQLLMSISNILCQIIIQAHPGVVSNDQKQEVIYYLHSAQIVGNSVGIALLIWYALTVYPTAVRGVFIGITLSYQIVIKAAAVFLLHTIVIFMGGLMENDNIDTKDYGPYIPLSLGYLIAAISCYYLPEIIHVPPPDTLHDVSLLQKRNVKYRNYNDK